MTRFPHRLFPVLAVLILSSTGCMPAEEDSTAGAADTRTDVAASQVDATAMRQGIDETNRAAEEALAAGDVAGFVQRVYTEDAVILPPDAPRISGHGEIEAFWNSAAQQLGLTGIRLQSDEVVALGPDMAYEIGTGTLETPQGNHEAKYVVIWERGSDGMWRWHVDIWNNAPAPTAED